MGAARAAALLGVLLAAAAGLAPTPANPTLMPQYMKQNLKLNRAHKNKLLVRTSCAQYCKNVVWQYKEGGESTWKWADAEPHSSFPDTFYVRRLRSDTPYVLRALLKPSSGPAYTGDEVPTLEARTCPERLSLGVQKLRAHSAGPGWLEVRWTPPATEACHSDLYYQARYAVQGETLGAWRDLGYIVRNHWVTFKPTHPCAAWPDEFCALFTDLVKAGEQHVVEVRVSRFGETPLVLGPSRRLELSADTACIFTNSCGVIGAATPSKVLTTPTTLATETTTNATTMPSPTKITTTTTSTTTQTSTPAPTDPPTATPSPSPPDSRDGAEGSESPPRAACAASGPAGEAAFYNLAPLFLALALLAFAALPAAFFWGRKTRWVASEAMAQHMVPVWRRQAGDGGSQPVLGEDGGEADGLEINAKPSSLL